MKVSGTAKSPGLIRILKTGVCLLLSTMVLGLIAGCETGSVGKSGGRLTGVFGEIPFEGVAWSTPTMSGVTDNDGKFEYLEDEEVTFSIGSFSLGTVTGSGRVTTFSLIANADDFSDPRVGNLCSLLYSLDADGTVNNGIRISSDTTEVISSNVQDINIAQSGYAFGTDSRIAALFEKLNGSGGFTDYYRVRTLMPPAEAVDILKHAVSVRKDVEIRYGIVNGFESADSTWQFFGIPYAKPPVGDLRWTEPQEPETWGYREAVQYGDKCPQDPANLAWMGGGGVSEDCLYLNITVPQNNDGKLPVMVWFHGGGFVMGAGNSHVYNHTQGLPEKGVIVVSVNHRLGPFGFLAHSDLANESPNNTTGNYGMLDLVESLQWIKENISAFGGDPDNVTIFGQSGGGGKVTFLMNSPLAEGLFHKAICISGMADEAISSLNGIRLENAENMTERLFGQIGVSSIEEARAVPAFALIMQALDLTKSAGEMGIADAYGPVVDNFFIPSGMYESIRNGLPNDVPFLAGATNGDMPGILEGFRKQMPLRAEYSKAEQFFYRFDKVPAGWADMGILCGHTCDLIYVFDYPEEVLMNFMLSGVINPKTGKPLYIGDLNGNGQTGSGYPPGGMDIMDIQQSAGWDSSDDAVAENVTTMWTNFAKTGNPGTDNFKWEPFTPENNSYVVIDEPLTVKSDFPEGY